MSVRERVLPPGWYPGSKSGCLAEMERFVEGVRPLPAGAKVFGGIVPHAGWYFSGKAAARVFYLAAKASQPEVVCVFGGHLGGGNPPLLVREDAWDTPLGAINLATDFFGPLGKLLPLEDERPGDNTIEVQLPFVKHYFPKSRLLAVRAPHDLTAVKLGQAVVEVARDLKHTIMLFGSTDLTHYGPNYGWAPKGYGRDAVAWVKEVNDKKFIGRALDLDPEGMLSAGVRDQSACSAGGAAAAVAAAKKLGAAKATLIDYYTSYDVQPGDSFVGYAGIVLGG
jgi:AmmeMemoRadiSam system protein B